MRLCLSFVSILLLAAVPPLAAPADSPEGIFEHTRSVYAALTSYSDSGTVTKEYTATSQDKYNFATHFNRAPRHFIFDFNKPSGDRIVVWGDPDAFHVWWKATTQVTDYPNPKNTGAITLNSYPTADSITKIVPLLYAKAGLPGALAHFEPSRVTGMEDVGGGKCYRLEGASGDVYGGTGKKVNVRNVTVWIDSSSSLVRKIIEEAPASPGMLNRVTTTFDPQANPPLSEDLFKFAPPKVS